jgi:hypothetical protein
MGIWVTKLKAKPTSDLLKVLGDIAKRDASFRFKSYADYVEVYSSNKNQAMQRGMWFYRKFGIWFSYFEVRQHA